ncbi:hypothetical protein ACDL92_11770 [Ihubacter sp. mB4P-1]|uniref:hypothetical protein n=1 Tax=Ihubacter sp. mB4P-1 TaxID=3242370 RepID=UPI003C7AAFAA
MKNLIINSCICDTRNMQEEAYKGYESIIINAEILLVGGRSKTILTQLPTIQNCDITVELDDDEAVEVNLVDGDFEITASDTVQENSLLVVNGLLKVEAGAEDALKAYKRIIVTGSLQMPKSLSGFLNKIQIEGATEIYPDGYTVLGDTLMIDKLFALRAEQNGKYYVSSETVFSGKSADLKKLVEKEVKIVTPKLLLPEAMIEDSAAVFNLQTEYVIIPDGMELIYGDAELDDLLLQQHGDSLFIYGDLTVDRTADMGLLAKKIDRLEVTGMVTVTQAQKEDFLKIGAVYQELKVVKGGRVLSDKLRVKVDQRLLDRWSEGIEICDVLKVVIDSAVKPEDILEKLAICECGSVVCSPEQESAVAAVSEDVGQIGSVKEFSILDKIKSSKLVNAEKYVM